VHLPSVSQRIISSDSSGLRTSLNSLMFAFLTQPALDYGFVTGIIVRNVIAGMVQLETESKKQEEKVQ
jgi:hypothetical protein